MLEESPIDPLRSNDSFESVRVVRFIFVMSDLMNPACRHLGEPPSVDGSHFFQTYGTTRLP
jgi:hypothetical protein